MPKSTHHANKTSLKFVCLVTVLKCLIINEHNALNTCRKYGCADYVLKELAATPCAILPSTL